MTAVNLGFGLCPMGSTPMGFGLPGSIDAMAPRPLIRVDGTQGDAALIDTTTGDYVLDASGNKVGWGALDQEVYLRLRQTLGSSADADVGIDLPVGGNITPDLAQKNRNAVELALQPLTAAAMIEIVDVITTRINGKTDAITLEVRWRDLSAGDDDKLTRIPAKAF